MSTRLDLSVADLQDLIKTARRINALTALHGVAVDEARRLAEDELGARAAAEQPAGGVVPPPRLTTEKRRYPEPARAGAADGNRHDPVAASQRLPRTLPNATP